MKALLAGFSALGPLRLTALAGVGVATLGLLAVMAMHLSGTAPMALLYNDLDLRDASAMADALDKDHIPHQTSADGASLMVPRDQVAAARLDLAKAGLPSGGSIGYEIFDRGDGLTASQFQQNINETRALEGELARSIRLMRGVRGVRVHLVLPRHEPFAQEQQEAQASVMLSMAGAARLDRESIQAIINLVAGAVPGLKPQSITIVDDRGELLARAGQPSDGAGAVATEDELKRATETRLAHAVEAILAPSLGQDHVRAEAAVEMDFDQTRETDEKFDPDGQVARSTESVTDDSKTTEKDASVSVQNNLPNPGGGSASGAGTQDQRRQETTNFEIGKTTREIVHDQPRIRRITLAVMVDGVMAPGPDGKPVWAARSPDQLAQIATLARGVIGYDAQRGDRVDIVSMRFADDADAAGPITHGLFGLNLGGLDLASVDIGQLVQLFLFALVALIVVLAVLRPAALRLSAALPGPSGAGAGAGALSRSEGASGLLGGQDPAGLLTDESMIDITNVEGQIRASSIRRIADLVEKHPDESLTIVRNWMTQEAG